MDIINGERAIMNTNHKIKFLLENVSDLDFNIDDAEISYLINGKTNDSYLLDFKKFKLVLRLNNKNSLNLGINRQNESLILQPDNISSFLRVNLISFCLIFFG